MAASHFILKSSNTPPTGDTEGTPPERKRVTTKLFTPASSWTWYIVEYDPEFNEAFGYAFNSAEPENAEWGYINLDELKALKTRWGTPAVERDMHWTPKMFGLIKPGQD